MMTYEEWISRYALRRPHGPLSAVLLGRCKEATAEMLDAFPELRQAVGHVLTSWGKRGHFWCVAPDGKIIDPTAAQFEIIFSYEEWISGDEVAAGVCQHCGEEIWIAVRNLDEPPPCPVHCSDNCARAAGKALLEEVSALRGSL